MATNVLKSLNGFRLDKAHVLAVNRFSDFDTILATPDTFTPAKQEPYKEKGFLQQWMMDDRARDQFIALSNDQTTVYWNNQSDEPEVVHDRQNWTESYLQWSPRGTFLATIHKQGIALWGGESWERIGRFVHGNVRMIDFSPCETYLVTFSSESANDDVRFLVFGWLIVELARLGCAGGRFVACVCDSGWQECRLAVVQVVTEFRVCCACGQGCRFHLPTSGNDVVG
jgi:hypothetical protein